ncbi:MAG: YceI family protein [Bacteroidetes bacterium]|nr:YceI family protein [Bacteroidota bacterium]
MKKLALVYVWVLLLLSISVAGQVQNLTPVDRKESVKFKIKNFGLTVDGSFGGLSGKIKWDSTNVANSFFDISIDAASINTGIALRDKHLRKEDYFDVQQFPLINFKSTKISQTNEDGIFKISGTLTIKKTKREISFPFKVVTKDGDFLFTGQFTINRQEYGVGGNSLGMADHVSVFLDVRLEERKGL